MTEDRWNAILFETLEMMKEHVEPFISPIWKYIEVQDILLHGSASYIESDGEVFLMTNEHVARQIESRHLTHAFKDNSKIINIRNSFFYKAYPIDIAISEIDNDLWRQERSGAQAVALKRFAEQHKTVNGELLFFAGFSGERSRVLLENCVSRGTPFLTQECQIPSSVELANPEFHIAIPYPPELAETKNPFEPLPDPHGFSGSLLWNTKRVEAMQNNVEWNPSMAEVTGVIWGWPSSAVCILATKAQHINLKEMILDDSSGNPL